MDQPRSGPLERYATAKRAIGDVLRQLHVAVSRSHNEEVESASRELLAKLAEDRFTLAVLGQFSRGKSSLMNAIIGRDVLPTGVLPLTSAITILRFGPDERLVVKRKGVALEETAPLESLSRYVTQQENPGNVRRVEAVYVELPHPFLRQGLEFVDTPGIGSAIDANTATTVSFLPRCDAAIFVTSVDAPLTAVETEFLSTIRRHVRKLFVVINKMDLIGQDEAEGLVAYVSEALEHCIGGTKPRTYPVSARFALAKSALSHPASAYGDLGALEADLSGFLANERANAFLIGVLDKSVKLAAAAGEFDGIGARLTAMRDCILAAGFEAADLGAEAAAHETATIPTAEAATASLPSRDFFDDLRTKGCPVCDYLVQATFDLLAKWQYELSADESLQRTIAHEHGFCPLHTWQLASVSSPTGLSAWCAVMADKLSEQLAIEQGISPSGNTLISNESRCRICQSLREAEADYAKRLVTFLSSAEGHEAYSNSPGLCLRHLPSVASASSRDMGDVLVRHSTTRLARLSEEMRDYALKRAALRRELINREEEEAYQEALVRFVGHKRLATAR